MPPRFWMGTCHRDPRFATRSRLPGPVRQPLLSRRMARQRSCAARSSRTGERCRAPPDDFCNRNDPRARPRMSELRSTTPAVARWCSRSPGGCALSSTFRAADGRSRLRELASRGSTGQGSRGWQRRCRPLRDLSYRDRSREELGPNPNRLEHPMSRTVTSAVRNDGLARNAVQRVSHGSPRPPALARLRASQALLPQALQERAASHADPRRSAHSAAPEVPSIAR
jgi:hypothetical protein